MDKIIEELKATLADWKTQRAWGCIEIQVSDGEPVLIRKETKKKLNGGVYHGPSRESR